MHAQAFWDKRAEKYAASAIGDEAAYTHTLDRTRAHLEAKMRVLELGCGTGTTALHLAPAVREYVGTDVSSEMIRIARDKSTNADGLRFDVAGAADALARSAGADAICAFNLLHLLPDVQEVVQKAHDLLDPGGLFISKTACIAEPSIGLRRFAFAALVPVMRLLGVAPFVHHLTFAQLERMMTQSGLEIIETGCFPAMSRYIVARKPAQER